MTQLEESTIHKLFRSAFIVCVIGLLTFTGCESRNKTNTRATAVFMRYFFQKTPESVTSVRIDQPGRFYGRTYTLRFSINKKDFTKLKESKPFVKVWNLRYKNGSLSWDWDRGDDNDLGLHIPKHGSSLSLYGSVRKPRWFKPNKSKDPEVYAFYQVGNLENLEVFESDGKPAGRTTILVLIYNEKEAQAYLVARDYSH